MLRVGAFPGARGRKQRKFLLVDFGVGFGVGVGDVAWSIHYMYLNCGVFVFCTVGFGGGSGIAGHSVAGKS